MLRTYQELSKFKKFEDRFNYLKLNGQVAHETFGYDRYMSQMFYLSLEWKHIRNEVIIRDNGCDLGCPDRPISGPIYIHHMNPLKKEDIEHDTEYMTNLDYLICTSYRTHNAIHYGSLDLIPNLSAERKPNDTCPWR